MQSDSQVSVPQAIIPPGKSPALRIAFFQALGFGLITGGITWVDPRLAHHVKYPARQYPWGYWVCASSILILFITYVILCWLSPRGTPAQDGDSARKERRQRAIFILVPSTLPLVWCAVAQPFFMPECPHGALWGYMLLYGIASLVTLWAHIDPIGTARLCDPEIDNASKRDWIKEVTQFWRTAAFGIALGYMALVVQWQDTAFSTMNPKVSTDAAEIFLLNAFASLHLAVFTLFVIFGPLIELMRKVRDTQDLLLKLPKEANLRRSEEIAVPAPK